MVTDLRRALRDAVAEAPAEEFDIAGVVNAGARRVRRRRLIRVAAPGVVVAIIVAVVALPHRVDREEPAPPVAPVELKLDHARTVDPVMLASRRVHWSHPDDIDYDNFGGLTHDGLVLRARYTHETRTQDYGLLDLNTGRTDWLSLPSGYQELAPVDLAADRLVFLDRRYGPKKLVVYDRVARRWDSRSLGGPAEPVGRFFGSLKSLGGDGRVYVSDGDLGLRWWSVPLATGGAWQREPDIEGRWPAWQGDLRATSDLSGRVELTRGTQTQVVAPSLPSGCAPPEEASFPPPVVFAGNRLVVTFDCRTGSQIVVYDEEGRPYVSVERSELGVAAAGPRYVLLTGEGRTWALDLEHRELLALDSSELHEDNASVESDLVLWNIPGPSDNDNVYDVIFKAARIP